jgi:hypothetical protein
MAGYIVNDQINASVAAPRKWFSKASVLFKMETAGTEEILQARANTPESQAPTRFFDAPIVSSGAQGGGGTSSGMTAEQITYVGLQSTALADTETSDSATFLNKTIATPPLEFPSLTKQDFQVFINGVAIPSDNITSIIQSGSNIVVTFSNLGFTLDTSDQVLLVGKFS